MSFTLDQVERMAVFVSKTKFHDLSITTFYLSNKDRSIKEIAYLLGETTFKVKLAINAYVSDKCVIVESRMNQ